MRHPGLAGALVLGGTFSRFNSSYVAWLAGVFGVAASPEEDAALVERNHPEWAAWLRQIYGPDAWPDILARVRPMWTTPFDYAPEALARVTAPTLVLLGDRDEVLPVEEAAELYRRLPAASSRSSPAPTTATSSSPRSPSSRPRCWTSCAGRRSSPDSPAPYASAILEAK